MITEKRMQFLVDELDQLRQQGLFRPLRVLGSAQDTEVVVDGKHVLNLSSNNYLGLTTHPRLKAAMIDATERWGAGSGAVRTIAGTMTVHEDLERRLAEFKHTEASLVFQSGFTANLGVLHVAETCKKLEGIQCEHAPKSVEELLQQMDTEFAGASEALLSERQRRLQ